MQKILTLITLLAATTLHAQMKWEWISPLPQGNTLTDIHFTDTRHGIAIGEGGSILRTTDGGSSWSLIDNERYGHLYSLAFADIDRGIIVGDSIILRTRNGGQSWERIIHPERANLFQVTASNSGTLLAIASDRATLHRSTDDGETWTTSRIDTARGVNRLAFVDDSIVVAGIGNHQRDSSAAIYRSTDTGSSWSRVATLPESIVTDFSFTTAGVGIAAAGRSIYATDDRGASWRPISPPLDNGLLGGATLIGTNGVMATSSRGTGFRSSDMGTTWDTVSIDASPGSTGYIAIGKIVMIDTLKGFANGYAGKMFRTDDGGRSWDRVLPIRQLPAYYCVEFGAPGQGVIVGDTGTVLHSEDGGRSWDSIASGTTQRLNAVALTATGNGFIVGDSGVMLRTRDGGRSWSKLNRPTSENYRSVDIFDAEHAMAVSNSRTIISTSDGGDHWDVVYPQGSSENRLDDIVMIGPRTAIATGTWIVVRTIDGGGTWSRESVGAVDLLQIEFIDSLCGYATGYWNSWDVTGPPIAFRTTDGGGTWLLGDITNDPRYDFGYLRMMNALEPLGPGKAIAIGSEGFYQTSDTGRTWAIVGPPPTWFMSMARTGEGGLVGVGYDGTIMRAQLPVDSATTRIVRHESSIATGLALEQNTPNPFTGSTTIRFRLPSAGHASLTIYDPLGRVVAVPVDEQLGAGEHSVSWGSGRGIYLYVLRQGGGSVSRVMICR